MRAGEMHAVAFRRRDKGADLLEAFGGQPALAATALNGEAVGRLLIRTAELVTAFVCIYPELNRRRDLVQEARVHDQKARIGRAEIVELAIDDRGTLTANLLDAIELQIARREDVCVSTDMGAIFFRRRHVLGACAGCEQVCRHLKRCRCEQSNEVSTANGSRHHWYTLRLSPSGPADQNHSIACIG